MKFKDPTIRACHGPVAPIKVTRPSAPLTPRAHVIGKVVFVPKPVEVIDRVLPGGLPPVANRTPWKRMADTGKVAREPFASKEIKGEHWATKRYLD